jgi:hypothetical protein
MVTQTAIQPSNIPPESASSFPPDWGHHPEADPNAEVMIDMNATVEDDKRSCADARLGGTHHHAYAMPYEQTLSIVICRGVYEPLWKVFPKQRHIN